MSSLPEQALSVALLSRAAVVAVLLGGLAQPSGAQCLRNWTAWDGGDWDVAGNSVASDGRIAFVGVPHQFHGGPTPGAVYSFDSLTGATLSKYVLPAGDANDAIGDPIAVSEDLLVLGISTANDFKGSVAVIDRVTGALRATLVASDGDKNDGFGWSVAVAASTLLVGAPNDWDTPGGSAYLFDLSTGTEIGKLTASDGANDDWFGASVDLDGGQLIIGAPDAGGTGAAYVFDQATQKESLKLVASDGQPGDQFGWSVAICGDRALVGAPSRGAASGDDFGGVYLFDATSGAELMAEQGPRHSILGRALDCRSDSGLAVVGAPGVAVPSGFVRLLRLTDGATLEELAPAGAMTNDEFGFSVSLGEHSLLAGAPGDEQQGKDAGAAYSFLFRRSVGESYCGPATLNSTGQSASLLGAWSGDLACPLGLVASGLPRHELGYLLASQTPGFVPFAGGSQGHLCLGGTIGRFLDGVQDSGVGGVLELVVDLARLPAPLPPAVQSGETWHFQAWFRDHNPGPTSNFTDGLAVTF